MGLKGTWGVGTRVALAILDAILPPKERAVRLRDIVRGSGLPLTPGAHEIGRLSITTLMDYRAEPVQDAIRALKYDGNGEAARLLADALAEYLREEAATARAFSPRPILIAPVPLHPSRRAERGFNQVERVLALLPREMRDGTIARVMPHALARTRATPAQTRLARAERLANVRGAFAADGPAVRGTHVFIIDDVTTTGATLAACAEALEKAGARITAIALARA